MCLKSSHVFLEKQGVPAIFIEKNHRLDINDYSLTQQFNI